MTIFMPDKKSNFLPELCTYQTEKGFSQDKQSFMKSEIWSKCLISLIIFVNSWSQLNLHVFILGSLLC